MLSSPNRFSSPGRGDAVPRGCVTPLLTRARTPIVARRESRAIAGAAAGATAGATGPGARHEADTGRACVASRRSNTANLAEEPGRRRRSSLRHSGPQRDCVVRS